MKIAHSSLQRFYDRYEQRQYKQRLRETQQLAREILADPDVTDAQLLAASTRLANIRLLQFANDPNAKIQDLKSLFQIQIRLKTVAVAEQRLALQQQRDRRDDRSHVTPSAATPARDSAPCAKPKQTATLQSNEENTTVNLP